MHILQKIAANKKLEIDDLKIRLPLEVLEKKVPTEPRNILKKALADDSVINIIAEIKKGSPSKGIMKEDFDPITLSTKYHEGGAAALSVLTESKYFYGAYEYLDDAKKASSLPVLCKDFILEPYQLFYARYMGADAILLIVSMHSESSLSGLIDCASRLGLDCLVETHDADEVRLALDCGADIIGVNNRNLVDFSVDIETSKRLAPLIPNDIIKVSESGIYTHDDITRLRKSGYSRFLVGEALVKADDPVRLLRSLRKE